MRSDKKENPQDHQTQNLPEKWVKTNSRSWPTALTGQRGEKFTTKDNKIKYSTLDFDTYTLSQELHSPRVFRCLLHPVTDVR